MTFQKIKGILSIGGIIVLLWLFKDLWQDANGNKGKAAIYIMLYFIMILSMLNEIRKAFLVKS